MESDCLHRQPDCKGHTKALGSRLSGPWILTSIKKLSSDVFQQEVKFKRFEKFSCEMMACGHYKLRLLKL